MENPEENLTEDTVVIAEIEKNTEPVKEKLLIRIGKRIAGILILAVLGFVIFFLICNLKLWGSHPG
jgi:tetrahydromethanopterin S-methyltransferase subunit G